MSKTNVRIREIDHISTGIRASDGAGVKLTRLIGSNDTDMVDPLLLLDMFGTDQPEDYIGGFPAHPHRGFETVTYILAGRMRHKDNAGHEGVIEAGGIQWMSAGRGIVHSEMPEQEDGLLQGFQLWINLPASQKMSSPAYQEFTEAQIPVEALVPGLLIKTIAGRTDRGTEGPISNTETDPLYLDVELAASVDFSQQIASSHNAIIYAIDGDLLIGKQKTRLSTGQLAVLGDGERIEVLAEAANNRFLVIAGKRLDEPVARGGPFVMNTRAQVLQAFEDYQNGKF